MDVTWHDRHVVVQYHPKHGYGVSASKDIGFGEKPDEVVAEAEDVVVRVLELLRTGADTRSPRLRELRESRQVTQAELGALLGVGQASVSKMERRNDLSLNSLRRFVNALGGELEVRAHFPDGDFAIVDRQDDKHA